MMTDLSPACPLDPQRPSLLIYDGHCRLCVTAKAGLDRAGLGDAGSGLRMIPYESEEAAEVLGALYRPGPPAMAFLVHPSGQVSQGLDAFLPLAPGLPGWRVVQWVLRWAFVRVLAERAYYLVARHRYRIFGAVKPPDSRL